MFFSYQSCLPIPPCQAWKRSHAQSIWLLTGVPEREALLTRGAREPVLLLAFNCDSNEVKRLLCNIAKVSVVSVSLPLSAVIAASVGFDSSY